jgi:hypothetical protein
MEPQCELPLYQPHPSNSSKTLPPNLIPLYAFLKHGPKCMYVQLWRPDGASQRKPLVVMRLVAVR